MLRKLLILAVLFVSFSVGNFALAKENSMALTIIPPLIKMNMNPGETISTAIRIVNNNEREVTIYTKVLDFRGKEEGGVEFIENIEELKGTEEEKFFLSGWITMRDESVVIPPFKDKDIPFIISVPEDATPGGHYAAVLAGTNPPQNTKGTVVKVSSYLSTLILVSIAGDIEERGFIREFYSNKKIYKEPKIDFQIKFENQGNVHLQPVGNIKIYNIFGKIKGEIPVNQMSNFGNVLPKNKRSWNFSWESLDEVYLINRYKAELALSFGEQVKQSDHREIIFWIINVKLTLIILGSFLVLLFLFILSIKFYIRASVKSMKRQLGVIGEKEEIRNNKEEKILQTSKQKSNRKQQSKNKVVDLRKRK